MSDIDEGKMSFFEHLAELRTRIVWSLIPSALGLGVALYFTPVIMKFIQRPMTKMDTKLVFTQPTEAFWTFMKVAMITGLFIAMPIILWNVWAFIAPGLHRHEKKYAAPFIIIGSLMFLLGGAFAMLVIVPYASNFLVNFGQDQGLQAMISVASYTDFVLKFALAFGLVFELPVVITMLSMIGVVTPQFLSKNRKYAILLSFVVAAVLTPTPDIINQLLMAGPLCLLYELGILSARIFGRRGRRAPAPASTASVAVPPGDGGGS